MTIVRNPNGSPIYAPARLSLVFAALLGSIVGGAFIAFLSTGEIKAAGITYPDLAAILLSAVGVIVAIFGGVLAIAAFWGFQQMKQEAVRTATEASLIETKEQIENGSIRRYILEEVEARVAAIVASPDFERRVEARVDQIVLGNPEDLILNEENGEE